MLKLGGFIGISGRKFLKNVGIALCVILRKKIILLIALTLCSACTKNPEPPLTIAINPWPGYEFLYLAEHQGFFEQVGANIKLVQLASLADTQAAYIGGRTDGLAGTLIESVQAELLGGEPLNIILIPDYSNGGDVVIAGKETNTVSDLKGLRVGCEVSSLGIYFLQRTLASEGLSISDVLVINVTQADGEQALLEGKIDAFVSYPPVSINLLKHDQFHSIFSSADIPYEIIDTISLSVQSIEENPGIVEKIHDAWQLSLDFYRDDPKTAIQIMAEREGVSTSDFEDVLADLIILDKAQQRELFSEPEDILSSLKNVCQVLVNIGSLTTQCEDLPNIVYSNE